MREETRDINLRRFSWEDRCSAARLPPRKKQNGMTCYESPCLSRVLCIVHYFALCLIRRAGCAAAALHTNAANTPPRITSRCTLRGGWPLRAAVLPVIFRALQSPCPHSRRAKGEFLTLCNYVIFSVPRGLKLCLRRVELHLRRFSSGPM